MKVLKILGAVFGLLGTALLAAALALYFNTRSFTESAERADGVVVDLTYSRDNNGSSYYPVVSYRTRDGNEIVFQSNVGSSPAAYDVGESVVVLYEPGAPNDASIDNFWQLYLLPTILGGIGAVFFAVGGGLFISHRMGVRKRERLLASGRRITTQIQGVDLNHSVRVNGRHPYCITSQWLNPDTGAMHVFRSDGIWFDPTSYLSGDTIEVLIDPVNSKRYYVDTSFLPQEG